MEYEGKFYLYYSSVEKNSTDVHEQCIKVAVSDSPEGPFDYIRTMLPPFSIDAHAVSTEDGLYLFYSINDAEAERAGTLIVADKMTDPCHVEGNPAVIVRGTIDEEIFMRDRFRKGQHWHTLEGAFYFREGDYHYILYSGNCYETEYYYIGYAVAKTNESDLTKITFKKYPDEATYRPLISANEFESGTGHNSLIKVNGEYYVIYHGRDNVDNWREMGECRTARICRLNVNGEQLTVERFSDKV
jgi:GH43 family beta-xylosidase